MRLKARRGTSGALLAAARNLAAVLAKEDRFAYRSLRKLANLEHQAGDEGTLITTPGEAKRRAPELGCSSRRNASTKQRGESLERRGRSPEGLATPQAVLRHASRHETVAPGLFAHDPRRGTWSRWRAVRSEKPQPLHGRNFSPVVL